jgi:glycosyltransferase involved in cell wall biosynthesis
LTSKVRVCFLSPEFIPNWGGTGTYTINLLRNLPREVEVHVVTTKRTIVGEDESEWASEDKIADFLGRPLKIHYLSAAKDTFMYNLRFQLECAKELPRLDSQYHFDIVHSTHPHMPDLYYQLTPRKRIRTVTTVHDFLSVKKSSIRKSGMNFFDLDQSEKAILMLYPFLHRFETFYIKRVPVLIAPSDCIAGILASFRLKGERIHVIRNGVDTTIFSRNQADARNPYSLDSRSAVLFTGRLVSHKGIDTILSAIPTILEDAPDTQFVFTGAGLPEQYLSKLKDPKVKESIRFLGYLDNYFDMSRLYSSAAVFVLPSLFENCPMSVLEAMSCEVPVVASNVGGVPEIISSGENGVLIPPQDATALAKSVLMILQDKAYAFKLGQSGRRTVVERFSAKRMALETMHLYESTINEDSH